MKLLLEELDHQKVALEALIASFRGLDETSTDPDRDYVFANPLIKHRGLDTANIDIKMETGTGKTYVYTRAIYELHKRFGLFKFILVVPSPAIKIGTKNFIENLSTQQHFSQFYENTRIDLNVLNAGDFKAKSGRKNFPAHLTNFIEGSRQTSNTIQVLLVNAGMLTSSNMTKDDFDQTLLMSETSPVFALKKIRPIVIIDEPHRFPREGNNYKAIEALCPQMIIRFGATFPEVTEGKGKLKVTKKDYYRQVPQHNLTAVQSFQQGLVKGIDIYYPNLSEQEARNLWQVESVTAKRLVLKKKGSKEQVELAVGDNLADVDRDFEGDVTYVGGKELSSGLLLEKGMWLTPAVFRNSYQELVIKDAIDKHFEKEWQNFSRPNKAPRIKTLSLFFIDSIPSYREDEGWLKLTFERLLREKLQSLLSELQEKPGYREQEYVDFLLATQKSLQAGTGQDVHAGYFGEDIGSGDEAIQRQVDDILRNKERLLAFKDDQGNWLPRRFLFSKWTLREGWDNPNVFVIAKLRTSGSEISKIQEVGRGLRLPFDETGHRVTQDEWESRLAFLIGYDEKDFAQQLVGEVNKDNPIELNQDRLTEEMIGWLVAYRQKTDARFDDESLLNELDQCGIINRKNEFKQEVTIAGKTQSGYQWLLDLYPELTLPAGVITDNQQIEAGKKRVHLRLDKWAELKGLWREFSKRRLLIFEPKPAVTELACQIIGDKRHYQIDQYRETKSSLLTSEAGVTLSAPQTAFLEKVVAGIPYGRFLRELSNRTGLRVQQIHPPLVAVLKELQDGNYLSESSLKHLSRAFKTGFEELYSQAYHYQNLDFYGRTSIFDGERDEFITSLSAALVGRQSLHHTTDSEKYLYDNPPLYYDSKEPERDLLLHRYEPQVKIFGKLPRSAIQVPRYTGGTTTPDFIFVVESKAGRKLHLLVEGKAQDMRQGDKEVIQIQEKFFSELSALDIQYLVATEANDVYRELQKIQELE
ncbi:MAG: type III restriction-modification system endonuclease [Aerococcaceae bacterium]|nr:type III restriction-modification system endonuclease [Aerococcaceae bacterium]